MKKLTKKDLLYLWITSLVFLAIAFILCNTMYSYGSQLDWYSQHVSIAEYFRTLFYKTWNLIPDFAPNLGNGQNIFNFSYYGFLSPIILISYLLPWVPMKNYIAVSTLICVEIAMILLYIFLKKKDYKSETCFLSAFFFIMAAPISFQSHRHIMFINYMPFLILGLFGVDKKIEQDKNWLLALSIFLMIMTSYYFSIGGMVCLIIYGIYSYLKKNKKITIKDFTKFLFKLSIPFIVAVLSSTIITLPTLYALFSGRDASNVVIDWKELLIPNINTRSLLYYHYGLGLTIIIVPAIISFFKKKKENIFLGTTLILLVVFNLFNYILNGTMYIDAKTLIPFLPLYIYVIAEFVEKIFNKEINFKVVIPFTIIVLILMYRNGYNWDVTVKEIIVLTISIILYYLSNKKVLLIVPLLIITTLGTYYSGQTDNLELKLTMNEQEKSIEKALDTILDQDNSAYRISNGINITETTNKIYNRPDYYASTLYSSSSNKTYNEFYYDVINNEIPTRNRALTTSTQNIFFLMLSGNKYVITRNEPLQGYELISTDAGINIYKNENVFPIGFANSNIISYEYYDTLNDAVKEEALLYNIVADSKINNNFVSNTKELNLDFKEILQHEKIKVEEDGSFTINADTNIKIIYNLPEEYQNKILFISFDMNEKSYHDDMVITINNVKNKLTATSWKYYNRNERFSYVLALKDQTRLTFKINEGTYNISNFETYMLDYAYIENASSSLDKLVIDKEYTKGDKLVGNIDVTEDGYLMLTVPYDKGFTIKVDGKVTEYEKVDTAFLGCKITKGSHKIEIEYRAPLKNISMVTSLLGIISYISIAYLESKRKI